MFSGEFCAKFHKKKVLRVISKLRKNLQFKFHFLFQTLKSTHEYLKNNFSASFSAIRKQLMTTIHFLLSVARFIQNQKSFLDNKPRSSLKNSRGFDLIVTSFYACSRYLNVSYLFLGQNLFAQRTSLLNIHEENVC